MATIGVYFFLVAVLVILKFVTGWIDFLPVSEMFYGPAITIASGWIIFAAIYALLGNKADGRT